MSATAGLDAPSAAPFPANCSPARSRARKLIRARPLLNGAVTVGSNLSESIERCCFTPGVAAGFALLCA
eukprot:1456327-Pyramimonas_sp.AAC.1